MAPQTILADINSFHPVFVIPVAIMTYIGVFFLLTYNM
ncbi:hypothetical protein D1BOALGB6SA_6162 [Olavius sp. associated proteobacterium Delta 1]|nr:hypothetical protein D1BOALGB6SA_6162 [Olavius sp. associated proteobacterium Delta 1]